MSWRLIFTEFEATAWAFSAFFAISLAIAFFIVLRRYEAQLVAPSIGRTLLCLRIAVLILLLITMLKPVITSALSEGQQQRIVVGFDVSESMETADRHATRSEKLRWGQALGMLGNNETQDLLDAWAEDLDAGREPDWGNGDNDLAGSRQEHMEGVFRQLGDISRMEFVKRLLLAKPGNFLGELDKVSDYDLRLFGAQTATIGAKELSENLEAAREPLQPGATDAVRILTDSIAGKEGGHVRSIILFTDGRQTVPADLSTEAGRLATLGIPVYCIPIGSIKSPRDLSVATVDVPQSVFLNDHAQVEATLLASGFTGDEITVRLLDGDMVIDEQKQVAAQDSLHVHFQIPSSETGLKNYRIETDVHPGEIREDNNSREFSVSVIDNKSRVLLVEGDARWEFRYLQSALKRDTRVELSTILFRQPYLQLLNRTFLDLDIPPREQFREQLANTDLMVIGDVAPENLSEAFWEDVERAVADDGLSLLIIPGRRHMPFQYRSPTLTQLLPVRKPTQRLAERYRRSAPGQEQSSFRLQVTPAGSDLTLFDLSTPGEDGGLASLPGHPWVCTGTPAPAATVWATATQDGVDWDPKEVSTVVHQYYGFGQVIWFGLDSTWRWRRRAGDRWHHRFWGQMVRWAARNKGASGNDSVRMSLSHVIAEDTDTVDVAVRWNPRLIKELKGTRVSVLLVPEESDESEEATSERAVQLTPVQGRPERFTGQLDGLQAGQYRILLQTDNSRIKLDAGIETDLIIQKRLSTELANISCNRSLLNQISTVSGGMVLEPWQLGELLRLLTPQAQDQEKIRQTDLWTHWTLILLFFALLMAEWVIRKLNGLP